MSIGRWMDKKAVVHIHNGKFSFSSVTQLCPTLRPHESQHSRSPCPSPTPRVHPNPCPLSRWCHPTISSSVVPFSSCPQSFPASGPFPMSQLFTSGGQSIGVSASTSVLQMNTQDWSPLGWTGWILNYPYIHEISPTLSWCTILLMYCLLIEFCLLIFCWGFFIYVH